jgi:hypothetical protein
MMNALGWFVPRDPKFDAEADDFLPYTDSPVWGYDAPAAGRHDDPRLFDVTEDPEQKDDLAVENHPAEDRMRSLLVDALETLDAPDQQFECLRLAD